MSTAKAFQRFNLTGKKFQRACCWLCLPMLLLGANTRAVIAQVNKPAHSTSSEDERVRAERALTLVQRAHRALGGTALENLQTLSVKAKLQRFIKYYSVQGPTKVVEKEKTIGGKVELDFVLPGQFRKRLASQTLSGWGYDYEEVINGDTVFRDPPLRVRSAGREQRVIDVKDVERTLDLQTETVQQQISLFTLMMLLRLPPAVSAKWLYLGDYAFEGKRLDVVSVQGETFNPFVLFDSQTGLPAALVFAYSDALRPIVQVEVAAVDRSYIRRTFQRAGQETRARTEPLRRHEMRWLLNDYRNVDGVLLPHRITVMRDAEKLEELTFEEFKLNRPINPKRFKGEAKVEY